MADEDMDEVAARWGTDRDGAYRLTSVLDAASPAGRTAEIAAVIAFLAGPERELRERRHAPVDGGAMIVDGSVRSLPYRGRTAFRLLDSVLSVTDNPRHREGLLRDGYPRLRDVLAEVPEFRRHYEADVMILGGDMTGKALVPVVHDGGERWHGTLQEQRRDALRRGRGRRVRAGRDPARLLPVPTTPDELAELEADSERLDDLFHKEMLGHGRALDGDGRRRSSPAGRSACSCARGTTTSSRSTTSSRRATRELAEGQARSRSAAYQIARPAGRTRPRGTPTARSPRTSSRARSSSVTTHLTNPSSARSSTCTARRTRRGSTTRPALNDDLTLKHGGHALRAGRLDGGAHAIDGVQPVLSLHGHIHESTRPARIGNDALDQPG